MQSHKTLIISIILVISLIVAILVSCKRIKTFADLKRQLKFQQCPLLFFVVTVLLYSPSALFLANSTDMNISFFQFLGLILVPIVIFGLWANIMFLMFKEKPLGFLLSICFALTLCAYIQSNFLNFHMPILSGGDFDFRQYKSDVYISAAVWVAILIVVLILWAKLKKELYFKIVNILSALLATMQLVSLVVLVMTNVLTQREPIAINSSGQFDLGTDENVVLFLLDSIEGHSIEEFFEENQEYKSEFSDFTFFTECMGGGAPTQLGMPIILTGREYDGLESEDEYFDNAWSDTELYSRLKKDGYDVRFYSTPGSIYHVPLGIANNILPSYNTYVIGDKIKYLAQTYKLTGLFMAPQLVKSHFMMTTDEFEKLLDIKGDDRIYLTESGLFRKNYDSSGGIETNYSKAFRYYHLDGTHLPFQWNENLELDLNATWEQGAKGHFDLVADFLEDMKAKGIYDDALIIISGDHGLEAEDSIRVNPAVMIKRPQEHHESIVINTSPIMLRNLYATMATISTGVENVWGPTVYDIDEGTTNQSKLHTVTNQMADMFVTPEIDFEDHYVRILPESTDATCKEATVWNPYEINKVSVGGGEFPYVIEVAGIEAGGVAGAGGSEGSGIEAGGVAGAGGSEGFGIEAGGAAGAGGSEGFKMEAAEVFGAEDTGVSMSYGDEGIDGTEVSESENIGVGERVGKIAEGVGYLDGPMLANEFTFCVNFDRKIKDDIELSLDIEKILGDSQIVRINCNGHRLDTLTITPDNISDEHSVMIPNEYIKNNRLYFRFEMPMAVTPKMLDDDATDTNIYSVGLESVRLDLF